MVQKCNQNFLVIHYFGSLGRVKDFFLCVCDPNLVEEINLK